MKLVISLLVTYVIMKKCYFKYGWFKLLFHDVFQWHVLKPGTDLNSQKYTTCMHCGRHIKEDDRGIWIIDN